MAMVQMVRMDGLIAAKRALCSGHEVIACTPNPMGNGTNFKVIAIRREGHYYYGKSVSEVWYPIDKIVSILGWDGKWDSKKVDNA